MRILELKLGNNCLIVAISLLLVSIKGQFNPLFVDIAIKVELLITPTFGVFTFVIC